jgi:hypothetical protein
MYMKNELKNKPESFVKNTGIVTAGLSLAVQQHLPPHNPKPKISFPNGKVSICLISSHGSAKSRQATTEDHFPVDERLGI